MNFIKKNSKVVLAFIAGVILSGGIVYAATITASTISYDNTSSGLKKANGQDVTTAQEAIDVLTEKANNMECKAGYVKTTSSGDNYSCARWNNYITSSQTEGGSTLPDNSSVWIQENTISGKKEVCAVFLNGTVCLTNAPDGRNDDFVNPIPSTDAYVYAPVDIGNPDSTFKGYIANKIHEMYEKGATDCYYGGSSGYAYGKVVYNDSVSHTGIECIIDNSGGVYCQFNGLTSTDMIGINADGSIHVSTS